MPRFADALGELMDAGLLTRGGGAARGASCPSDREGFFGIRALDALVPSGLGRALHMFEAAGNVGDAAAAGFLVSILIKFCSISHPALWVSQDLAHGEAGRLYGPGLSALAIDPSSLVLARTRRSRDVLWAMEEGLRSGAVSAVVGEIHDAAYRLDLTATRRLSLQSERSAVPAYLLVGGEGPGGPTAARTHWQISSIPAPAGAGLLGPPAWRVDLVKNKTGPCGGANVGFDPARRRVFEIDGELRADAPHSLPAPSGGGAVIRFPLRFGRPAAERPS